MGGQIWGMFVPIFGDLGAFSMLARFVKCWGSLEASRRGMLEVIGPVGSMLKALPLLFYFFAAMLVHLAAFSLPFDLGR